MDIQCPDGTVVAVLDHTVDLWNYQMVAWQLLGNTDPVRDHFFISPRTLLIDGTIKAIRKGIFPRRWPNVVCSAPGTISEIDRRWDTLGTGPFIESPSLKYQQLCRSGNEEIIF
jgi:4-hydroxy-3-polyprenylbenzoate decarboxylase